MGQTKTDPLAPVRRILCGETPDAFELASAIYWYCSDWHGGQFSPEYAAMCSLGYRPGRLENGVEPESTEGMIYAALDDKSLSLADALAAYEAVQAARDDED